jgi:hypothetical protein
MSQGEWLETRHIVDIFGPTDAEENYRHYMAGGPDAATAQFYADLGW